MRTTRQEQIIKELNTQALKTRKRMILDLVTQGKKISEAGHLIQRLKAKTQVRTDPNGIPFKIAYGIPKYGIYRAVGVGRGRPIGSSKAKANQLEWYKSNIKTDLNKFAELFIEYQGEEMYKASQILEGS